MMRIGLLIILLAAGPTLYSQEITVLPAGLSTITVPDRPEEQGTGKMISVDVFVPKEAKTIAGDILVLPGWRFSRKRWHRETDILDLAEKMGFRAAFPEMGVSSYESVYYPETTMKWAHMPGGEWVRSVFLPFMDKRYGFFRKEGKNFILGLSTGGRGVLLVALQNPELFAGGATLSGDCDQTWMPNDRLMTALYGDSFKFKKRWETVDNPVTEIRNGKWAMPLYIGHGKKDCISPFHQSQLLNKALAEFNPGLELIFNAPENAGHDFTYWKSEVPAVMKFFAKIAGTD